MFYISGIGAAEDEAFITRAQQEGHKIGISGLRGEKSMEGMSQSALVEDFCRASNILKVITQEAPREMMLNATKYTLPLRQAAWAAGIEKISVTDQYLSFQSFTTYAQAKSYVDGRRRSSIVAVRLDGPLDETEISPLETDSPPAIDMEAAITTPVPTPDLSHLTQEERLLMVVEWLVRSLSDTNYLPESLTIVQANGGAYQKELTEIHTTRRASAFLFYGLGNEAELTSVLCALAETGSYGTFFVTREEAETEKDGIKAILSGGHDLGVALKAQKNGDVYTYCSEILNCKNILQSEYGYANATVVKVPYGSIEDGMREAAAAAGCTLLQYSTYMGKAQLQNETEAVKVYDALFAGKRFILHRGHLVYFRMGFYKKNDELLGDLVRKLAASNAIYPIESANTILANKALLYDYPVAEADILPAVKDKIYEGQLGDDFMHLAENYYIGNTWVKGAKKLPGFTAAEIRKIDHGGRIKNNENAIFLTFDDWGSDDTITKLLDVLKKHNAKVSFFVRTNNISYNPNLLRAIALEGHDIASHTDTHLVLANEVGNEAYTSITEEEQLTLKADMVRSYQALQAAVGDISINGRPALTTLFRPPTLAVSRLGMEAAFDVGFTYIVNGEYTSGDYMATNADTLLREIRSRIWPGTIIVLHMSDNSVHTAQMLDALLTQNEAKPPEKRFVCKRLSDYLDGSYTNTNNGQ